MFGCGKAFFAFALLIATPVATMAQTADNRPRRPARRHQISLRPRRNRTSN